MIREAESQWKRQTSGDTMLLGLQILEWATI